MKQIKSLADLRAAAMAQWAVVVPSCINWSNPRPAGFMMNLQGNTLFNLFEKGMYVYTPKGQKRQWGRARQIVPGWKVEP